MHSGRSQLKVHSEAALETRGEYVVRSKSQVDPGRPPPCGMSLSLPQSSVGPSGRDTHRKMQSMGLSTVING